MSAANCVSSLSSLPGADHVVGGKFPTTSSVARLEKIHNQKLATSASAALRTEEEALALLDAPPRISFNLGSGGDNVALTRYGRPFGDDTIDDVIEFFEVDSIDQWIEVLEPEAAGLGISTTLKNLRINGATGTDTLHPSGMGHVECLRSEDQRPRGGRY